MPGAPDILEEPSGKPLELPARGYQQVSTEKSDHNQRVRQRKLLKLVFAPGCDGVDRKLSGGVCCLLRRVECRHPTGTRGILQMHIRSRARGISPCASSVLNEAQERLHEVAVRPLRRPTAANDQVRPAGDLLPGIPAQWASLPTELVVNFHLTESGCMTAAMVAEYRRTSIETAMGALLSCHLYFVLLRYTVMVRGASPMLGWELDASLARIGQAKPKQRRKVQGVHPWEWQADDSLIEIYQHSPLVGFWQRHALRTIRASACESAGGRLRTQ
jgi:hypothetical protein